MKYHNGILRNEQDSTLLMRPVAQKSKMHWTEYLPLFILSVLVACLFVAFI